MKKKADEVEDTEEEVAEEFGLSPQKMKLAGCDRKGGLGGDKWCLSLRRIQTQKRRRRFLHFFLCFPEAEVLELSVGNIERKSGGSKTNRQGNEKQESSTQINNQINAQFYTNRGGSEKCWDVTIDGTF